MSTRQSGAWIGVHVTSFGSGLATCISDNGTFENLYVAVTGRKRTLFLSLFDHPF